MTTIYCLTPASYWATFAGKSEYVPRDYKEEGFIHATKGDNLLYKVANRVYHNFDEELLLLVIDEALVTSEIKYEQAKDKNLYPHIYGPLNVDAIVEVKTMHHTKEGWTLNFSSRI
ncbi:uncharacterized protein (DUF952 family) [Aneurinibacillus soli]|uniref:Uncharacterized protein n=1 Tax=Aneurinibacillus soli TaxID=1500254 RepID=A0A0U5B2W7_9BACL|nr:DUF952 domain-containing protein [Aneurinibacillus soli]PYE58978.1 uncharacterized protein (DUF952 family) [Aneurinibacillus soli]BAU26006.1 hypothetical protein CB4_00078 [Aneurinibacillus soli]